jgi:Domain of unknown function (DUF1772)
VNTFSHMLAAVALLTVAIIYGTDVFCAIVQRPALNHLDDSSLTSVLGRIHQYGDRRLPVPGALGTTAAALTAVTAALAGRPVAAAAAAAAVVALATWLVIYLRISAPINQTLTAAAKTGNVPPGARALQRRWDSVITTRAFLQAIAITALCAALAIH